MQSPRNRLFMSCWSALTAQSGLSLLCDVIQRMNGCWLRCACMQTWASTHHSDAQLTACQVENTPFQGGNRPTELPPARRHPHPPWGGGFSAASSPFPFYFFFIQRILFGGFTVFLSSTSRWQPNRFGKLLKNQTQPLFWNRICCDWTWIRRNRRLHGWSRSGCWNRRRRPFRILKRFSRVPWKMGWSYAGCWSDSARAPRRK